MPTEPGQRFAWNRPLRRGYETRWCPLRAAPLELKSLSVNDALGGAGNSTPEVGW